MRAVCERNHSTVALWHARPRLSVSCRFRAVLVLALLVPLFALHVPSASAHPCERGHFYTRAETTNIANVSGNGAQAGWHEQYYELHEGGDHGPENTFVVSALWVIFDDRRFNEVGYGRAMYAPYYGDHFYRAARHAAGYSEDKIDKPLNGYGAWHVFRLEYSSDTIWYPSIDGVYYPGYGNPPSPVLIWVGNESYDRCSVVHTTYFGSSDPSSPYAFQYRTSWGQWTTWESGSQYADSPFRTEWLTYAIYRRGWGP